MQKKLTKALAAGATVQIAVEGINCFHLVREKIRNDPKYSKICLWDYKTEGGNEVKWLRSINNQVDRGIAAIGTVVSGRAFSPA